MKPGTLKLNVILIDKEQSREGQPSSVILKSGDDYDARLSKLNLQSLAERRFVRNVAILYNLINGHYKIDFSDKLVFCKYGNVGHGLRNNDSLDFIV